jgi:ribosomal protein S18 acetylase RimI-like enzyme
VTAFLHHLRDNDKGQPVKAFVKMQVNMKNMELELKLPIQNGYYAVPAGKLATLTTYYERMGPFTDTPENWPETTSYTRLGPKDTDQYRSLFRRVGEHLLWESRLDIQDDELVAVLSDPAIEAYAISRNGVPIGLLEIDFNKPDNAEIVYIGLVSDATGLGIGPAMMHLALSRSAARHINRIWLHTCHFDSKQAPRFYEKFGFRAYLLAIELMDDPRLKGSLPLEAAPHIPLILTK